MPPGAVWQAMQSPARARYSPRSMTCVVAFKTLEVLVSAPGRTTLQTIAAPINPPTRTNATMASLRMALYGRLPQASGIRTTFEDSGEASAGGF